MFSLFLSDQGDCATNDDVIADGKNSAVIKLYGQLAVYELLSLYFNVRFSF